MTNKVTMAAVRINSVFKPKPTTKENAVDAAAYGLAVAAFTGATSGIAQKSINKGALKQDFVSIKNEIKTAKQQNAGQEVINGLKNTLKDLKKQTNSNVLKAAGAAALLGLFGGIAATIIHKALYKDMQNLKNNNKPVEKTTGEQ